MQLQGITEKRASTKRLTNHQRIKDRELQRAMQVSSKYMLQPTRSRLRRAKVSLSAYNLHEMESNKI